MMLHHIDLKEEANRIETALDATLANKEECTGDLGGHAGTMEFAQHIIAKLK